MKKTALFILCGLLLCSYAASAQTASINPWTLQPLVGQLNYRDVVHQTSSVNNNMWVVGDDGVVMYMYRDNNGVEYWHTPTLNITNAQDYDFNSLCFMKGNVKYGWLVGEKKSDYSGILLRTTDYGYNWSTVSLLTLNLPAGTAFKSVSFADDGKGYIACGNGIILKSSDFGINWSYAGKPISDATGVSIWYQSIYTKTDNSDYVRVVGDNYGIVDYSLDGGASWSGSPIVQGIADNYYVWPDNTAFNEDLALAPFKLGHVDWLNYTVPYNHGYLFQNGVFSQPEPNPIWLTASNGYETVGSDGEILGEAILGSDIDLNCVTRQYGQR